MKLHLGVNNVAYSDKESKGATTTGEVAEILEGRYHVMEVFYELYKEDVAKQIEKQLKITIEAVMQGNKNLDLNNLPMGKLESQFKNYLDMREWAGVSGQVIEAAKSGVSHRKKEKKKATARPEFIDTGLYQESFRAWVTK